MKSTGLRYIRVYTLIVEKDFYTSKAIKRIVYWKINHIYR